MNHMSGKISTCVLFSLFPALAVTPSALAVKTEWTRRLASEGADGITGVAADGAGNIYFVGSTAGSLAAPFSGGYEDGFVGKYDSTGDLLWIHQLGTTGWDEATGIATDQMGNVYVAGHTGGVLGESKVAGQDSFVSKFDRSGNMVWTRQFGNDTDRFNPQYARGIAADGLGNLYVTGYTPADASFSSWDVYVTKLDLGGDLSLDAAIRFRFRRSGLGCCRRHFGTCLRHRLLIW